MTGLSGALQTTARLDAAPALWEPRRIASHGAATLGQGKQRLVSAARKAGLLPLAEAFRFARSALATRRDNAAWLRVNPGFEAPPLWWMHDMYAHTSYRHYAESGANHAGQIAALIERHSGLSGLDVAEWGCGLGRLVRAMPGHFRMTGFDYNPAAIDWCRNHVPDATFALNGLMPPLPAAEGAFDGLYCISVFTHLSESAHRAWAGELARVLKPGGILLASFHGPDQAGGLLPEERARFDAGELVVRDRVKEGGRTFVAYHPHAYVRGLLTPHFDIAEGPLPAVGQTVWIARRKS